MLSFLFLGLLVGMAHALEADHLAAVGTLAAKGGSNSRRLAWLGASWGLGHTTTLLALCLPVVLLGLVLGTRVEAGLESAVGVMLIALGVGVVLKLYRQKVHFHLHEHADGTRHFHAHSHKDAQAIHDDDPHHHKHARLFSGRSYLVGLAHGAAGSAGLVALATATTQSLSITLLYVLVFGIGSTAGMALLTLAASWPLRRAEGSAGWFYRLVQGGLAAAAVMVGVTILMETLPVVFAGVT